MPTDKPVDISRERFEAEWEVIDGATGRWDSLSTGDVAPLRRMNFALLAENERLEARCKRSGARKRELRRINKAMQNRVELEEWWCRRWAAQRERAEKAEARVRELEAAAELTRVSFTRTPKVGGPE